MYTGERKEPVIKSVRKHKAEMDCNGIPFSVTGKKQLLNRRVKVRMDVAEKQADIMTRAFPRTSGRLLTVDKRRESSGK